MIARFPIALAVCLLTATAALAEQHVVIVLDTSGSMQARLRSNRQLSRMDAAKEALLTVLQKIPQETHVGLLAFNSRTRGDQWILNLGQHEKTEIRSAIQRLRADGGTPLGQAMKDAADALLKARAEHPIGTFRLLVVTDGEATDAQKLNAYLPDVLTRGLVVDVIGVDMQQNHSLATQVHNYRRADDPQSLAQGIAAVFAETDPATDAAEADFALLEGFPPEVASASIAALTEMNNHPIGSPRPTPTGEQTTASPPPNVPRSQPQHPNNPPQEEGKGSGGFVWLMVFLVVVGFAWSLIHKLQHPSH